MIIKTLDAREEKITSDLQAAADAKEQAEQNVRSCDDRIAAAEREAQEIIAAAKREAENERTKIIAEAQASAVNIISKAHESIESERQKAMVELSGQVVDLSVEIAAKMSMLYNVLIVENTHFGELEELHKQIGDNK
jgi:F-type H+-transporting ATPase subunit b